jgi:hypothetical protein
MMNCGISLAGRPSLGSWLLYDGHRNQNLPGFIVLAQGFNHGARLEFGVPSGQLSGQLGRTSGDPEN